MGRGCCEFMRAKDARPSELGMMVLVVSTTLDPAPHGDVTVDGSGLAGTVSVLKRASGNDTWLFGGGAIFRSLLACRSYDQSKKAEARSLRPLTLSIRPQNQKW